MTKEETRREFDQVNRQLARATALVFRLVETVERLTDSRLCPVHNKSMGRPAGSRLNAVCSCPRVALLKACDRLLSEPRGEAAVAYVEALETLETHVRLCPSADPMSPTEAGTLLAAIERARGRMGGLAE